MSLKIHKVAIIGCAGSGKTTLAKWLGSQSTLPVYHLDYYYWKPGWVESDPDLFQRTHKMLIDQPDWIIDGNQMITIAERIAVAEMVVFLDIPTYICLWRVLVRWVRNRSRRVPGDQSIMTWGLLCYVWRYNRSYRPTILELIAHAQNDSNKIIYVVDSSKNLGALEAEIVRFIQ